MEETICKFIKTLKSLITSPSIFQVKHPVKTGHTPQSIEEQTEIVLEKITVALHENNLTVDDLVKITIYITDVSYQSGVRSKLIEFVDESKRTSTLVVVSGLIQILKWKLMALQLFKCIVKLSEQKYKNSHP